MKIITSFTVRWDDPELKTLDEESYEYEGPVAQCGGSASPVRYQGLEDLYTAQARNSEMLTAVARERVLPAYGRYLSEAEGFGSQANQEEAATRAGADSAAATTGARQALSENLASVGVDPSDERYARTFGAMETQGAAQRAPATTGARDRTRQLGLAHTQDAVSLGMGTPTQATAAANSAMQGMTSAANLQQQARQAQAQNMGNMVRGGIDLAGYGSENWGWFGADGGYVDLAEGGYVTEPVQKLAAGGIIRMRQEANNTPPPPPPDGAASAGQQNMQMMGTAAKGARTVGKIADKVGSQQWAQEGATMARYGTEAGSQSTQMLQAQDAGMFSGKENLWEMAKSQVDSVLPKMGGMESTTAAAPVVEAAPAATAAPLVEAGVPVAAETLGSAAPLAAAAGEGFGTAAAVGAGAAGAAATETAAGATIMETVGPYLAALLLKDGGPAGVHRPGAQPPGEIDGPGGPKDDLIRTQLPRGSFVLPVGTVKKYGQAALDKMFLSEEDAGQDYADGGMVNVGISNDEYVVYPAAVQRIGYDKLEKMRQEGLKLERQLGIKKPAKSKGLADGGEAEEGFMDKVRGAVDNMERAVNPVLNARHRHETALQDQPGRTLMRESDNRRGPTGNVNIWGDPPWGHREKLKEDAAGVRRVSGKKVKHTGEQIRTGSSITGTRG